MRGSLGKFSTMLIIGVLFASLFGLLGLYMVIVSDLPARVYTSAQQEYLSYNKARSIYQVAPTWNVVAPGEEEVVPAVLSDWESRVEASLEARYEEQERVSVTVFDLDFQSDYKFSYPGPAITTTVELYFPFPSNLQTLHNVSFLVDGEEPPDANYTVNGISWETTLKAGEKHDIAIGYRADGAYSFGYGLNRDRRSNVDITFDVSGLTDSEVPRSSLPPSDKEERQNGESFVWKYPGLIPSRDIQLVLPRQLSFAQQVAQLQSGFRLLAGLAPFLVFGFILSLYGLFRLKDISLGLGEYLLVGLCLALFFPALTFLSGLFGLVPAALLAFLAISCLVIAFLGLSVGWRETWQSAAWLLFIFLGIFSLGMFTPWRGLVLTGGALIFVAIFMISFARRPRAEEPEPDLVAESPPQEVGSEPQIEEPGPPPIEETPEPSRHCPRCGRALADDHAFCPGCGYEARVIHRCSRCGHDQLIREDIEAAYCMRCGEALEGRAVVG